MKKKTKTKLYKLLAMYPEDLSLSDWKFIHKHLTYEIVNKYIDKTGNAVLLPGITTDEERYWVNRLSHVNHNLEVYDAYIDTTFAVVKPDSTYSWAHKAIRVAGDFTCNHKPWYMNWYAPTEEQQYYIDNADSKFCSYKRLMQ